MKSVNETRTYDEWLREVLDPDRATQAARAFWHNHGLQSLIERWRGALPAERVIVMVSDESDRRLQARTFEQLLGLPEGLLTPGPHDQHLAVDGAHRALPPGQPRRRAARLGRVPDVSTGRGAACSPGCAPPRSPTTRPSSRRFRGGRRRASRSSAPDVPRPSRSPECGWSGIPTCCATAPGPTPPISRAADLAARDRSSRCRRARLRPDAAAGATATHSRQAARGRATSSGRPAGRASRAGGSCARWAGARRLGSAVDGAPDRHRSRKVAFVTSATDTGGRRARRTVEPFPQRVVPTPALPRVVGGT